MEANTSTENEILDEDTVGPTGPDQETEDDDGEDNSWKRPHTEEVIDDEQVVATEAELNDEARRARWQARRPKVNHLLDGVARVTDDSGDVTVVPLFDIGDRIVVDRRTRLLPGDPWLDTLVGKVKSIDDDTGMVILLDEESDPRLPARRYVSIKDELHQFKLAPPRGNPFNTVLAKAHIRQEAAKVAAAAAGNADAPVKRGRGRPAGTKNRPKEVIKAEREAYKKMMEEKRAARKEGR